MDLLSEHGHKYMYELPEGETIVKARCKYAVELLMLKQGKKKWSSDNIMLIPGVPVFIFSPSSNRYWYRIVQNSHEIRPYVQYILDGNLYLHFTEEWKEHVKKEREKEGMPYYDYMRIRELILLQEVLDKKMPPDYKTKSKSIEITINDIKHKNKKS